MNPDEIAKVLYHSKPTDTHSMYDFSDSTHDSHVSENAEWEHVVRSFANAFQRKNKSFNRDRFLALCQGEMIDVDSKAFVLVQRTLTPDAQES